jgi:galactokinase
MKTDAEVVAEFLEEDRLYTKLVQRMQGNEEALQEADHLYQEGVRVAEIERLFEENELN